MMQYKGYHARIQLDDEAGIFHGEVVGTKDVITFQGKSVDELRDALRDSVDDYLEFCQERGEQPEKPASGKFQLRLKPALHRQLIKVAGSAGKSLNAFIAEQLEMSIQRHTSNVVGKPGHKGKIARSKSPKVAKRSKHKAVAKTR
jgi:predicted HicB family RNase H-like nuclease